MHPHPRLYFNTVQASTAFARESEYGLSTVSRRFLHWLPDIWKTSINYYIKVDTVLRFVSTVLRCYGGRITSKAESVGVRLTPPPDRPVYITTEYGSTVVRSVLTDIAHTCRTESSSQLQRFLVYLHYNSNMHPLNTIIVEVHKT